MVNLDRCFEIDKCSEITICVIGSAADYERVFGSGKRKDCRIVSVPDDSLINSIITQLNPNAFVTFGDRTSYPNMIASPSRIRDRWINLSSGSDVDEDFFCQLIQKVLTGYSEPLVSVFTAVCAPGDRIFRAYQSLLDQTCTNWEWILVDDSDDSGQTYSRLQELSHQDHRIKPFKHGRHSGRIGEVKKWACGLCSGDILAELDHDDELTGRCLEWVAEAFKKYPEAGMVYTDGAEVVESSGQAITYPSGWGMGYGSYRTEYYDNTAYEVAVSPEINPKTIRHIVGMPNHLRAWRTRFYHSIGGHNSDLHVADDYDLMVRTFLGSRIAHVPKFGYIQYRNTTGNASIARNADIQRLVTAIRSHYDKAIHERFHELGIDDYVWTGTSSDLSLKPTSEQHCSLIV